MGRKSKRPNHQKMLSCLQERRVVAKRFNSAIPSSAAVERLFAVGSSFLRSKRSSMTKKNCEKFVLLYENEKCLKKSIFLHKQRIISECEWCFFFFGACLFL